MDPRDFNFGIPRFPFLAGRDYAGVVVQDSKQPSRLKPGDLVLCASTDYRDYRKAAFQEYAIATPSTVCRVPKNLSKEMGASLGVAFVASAIAMGVCFGAGFSEIKGSARGPNLLQLVRSLDESALPKDIADECMQGIAESEKPRPGEWIAIWGGKS
jgi:NADPH:quinone reductase-like Zn-dependent oxidoreductase